MLLPRRSRACLRCRYADETRNRVLKEVVSRGEARNWAETSVGVEWLETIEGGPGSRIRKLRYEALPGLWIPALLYEPESTGGKMPAILNVNGHDSEGKAVKYKQLRCINQAKRGMLALNVEWLDDSAFQGCSDDLLSAPNLHVATNSAFMSGSSDRIA